MNGIDVYEFCVKLSTLGSALLRKAMYHSIPEVIFQEILIA